jgi:hypothetical protein
MSSRERMLILLAGGTFGMIVVLWAYFTIAGMYTYRKGEIEKLEASLTTERRLERETLNAKFRMASYQERSLPPKAQEAKTLYSAWLIELFEKAGMQQPAVTSGRSKVEKKLYAANIYSLTAKGTLPQVVKMLHGFYSMDYLHRITKLHITPVKNSKDLQVAMDVEALSLEAAPPSATLKDRPSNRLALPKQEDYVRIISERNIFGSSNHAPQLAVLTEQKATRGRSVDFSLRGSDPDALDKLTYKMVKSGASDARLDASGRLSWTPRAAGKYEFVVRATDDGWPALSSKDELVTFNVEEPPPPPPEPPKKLAFDDAKFTFLSAVIDTSGVGQIWLSVRPKGQTLKLGVGDSFEVGSVKGTVVSIGDGDFTFEQDGKERKVSKGGILGEAISVTQE